MHIMYACIAYQMYHNARWRAVDALPQLRQSIEHGAVVCAARPRGLDHLLVARRARTRRAP